VCACAVFSGTHRGEGGPVPPIGMSTSSDYAYVMEFQDGKISHMTKIWNAGWAVRELGWTGVSCDRVSKVTGRDLTGALAAAARTAANTAAKPVDNACPG
jgi:hypothetical protein